MAEVRGAPFRAVGLLLLAWIAGRLIWTSALLLPTSSDAAAVEVRQSAEQSRTNQLPPDFTRPVNMVAIAPKCQALNWPAPVPALTPPAQHAAAAISPSSAPATQSIAGGPPVSSLFIPVNYTKPVMVAQYHPTRFAAANRSNVPDNLLSESRPALRGSASPIGGYFWIFARQNGASASPTNGPTSFGAPRYGGSQAGGILTYRLVGDERRYLASLVRASTSFGNDADHEIALGLRARPFARLPLNIAAEHRFGLGRHQKNGQAIYAATGIGPAPVIGSLEGEVYAQAGYRFGASDSYFFDAAASVQHPLLETGRWKLTAGAGAWAGGQKGAQRLDVGPRLNLHLPVGELDARLSLDWRQRIAGSAAPDSGAAIALTTGF